MKRFLFVGIVVIGLFVLGLVGYIKIALPDVGEAEDITVEITPERLKRGEYLANAVMACVDCHSERDWSLYAGPLVEGTLGMGGEVFSQELGFPGNYISKNLTPYSLGDWTDGEILRAISAGVSKDGSALFPVMPHPSYGKLDREDIYAVIAYIRSIAPIQNDISPSKSDFPMSLIVNTIPQKAQFTSMPETSNTLAYGEYLFTAASCTDCHTIMEKGKPVEGMYLAGGMEFPLATGGVVRALNITSDKETGIGSWTQEYFIQRFKLYADSEYVPTKINKGDFNTYMPWMMYSQMNEDDLGAIFTYLQTVKPVKNKVVRFNP